MKKLIFALIILGLGISQATVAAGMITIYLDGKYIVSTETRRIEVHDQVCDTSKGTHDLKGNQRIPIRVCTSDAGYGRVAYRNLTNNSGWTQSSLLHEGDPVSP